MTPSSADESQLYFLAAMLKAAAIRHTPTRSVQFQNPSGYHPGYELRRREMLHAKRGHWNGDEHRPQKDDLI